MSLKEIPGTGFAGKRIKRDHVITVALLIIILGGVCFFWMYLKQTNPVESIKAAFLPSTRQPKWVATIYGEGNIFLSQPRAVYVYKNRIYVSDTGNHRVVIFDYNGRYVGKFGDTGNENNQLIFPYGMTVVGNELLVCDAGLNRVAVFDLNGKFKRFFPAEISRPIYVAYHDKRLYFSDLAGHQVVVTDTSGKELARIGRMGRSGSGEFYFPGALAIAPDGRIIIPDTNNSRVQVLDSNGKFLEMWRGDPAKSNGYFAAPSSVALDKNGNTYVADPLCQKVTIIDQSGKPVGSVHRVGEAGEKESLVLPTGVWVDDNQYLYVADYGASRIVIYDLK